MSFYRIQLSTRATKDLREAHGWWAKEHSAEQAARWFSGILAAIDELRKDPERYSLAAEDRRSSETIRAMNYGLGRRPTHRVVFTVRDDVVFILAVRHVSRRPLRKDEL
jgi:plasmid stabilization system protein ParE